jgi:hypothetical protein
MNWLAENALIIWAAGAVALTLALVVYWETRSPRAQLAIALVVLVTAALLVAEWLIETPREAVARALHQLAATVEANDVPGALSYFSPKAAEIRRDVETLMPEVTIDMARIVGTPEIEVDERRSPMTAAVKLQGVVRGKVKRTSLQGTVPDKLTLQMEFDGSRWLILDYSSERNWTRELKR